MPKTKTSALGASYPGALRCIVNPAFSTLGLVTDSHMPGGTIPDRVAPLWG